MYKFLNKSLGDILLCETAGNYLEYCIDSFDALSYDNNYDVRKTFYSVIYKILTNTNIFYLRKYEHNLVFYLIKGLTDEREAIIHNCYNYIEL